jgi:hypothetical protein
MEYLGNKNLFASHFIIGSSEIEKDYTQTETSVLRALQKWLKFKDTDWGMKRYRTESTQYVCFLHLIDIKALEQLLIELATIYKKHFPFSTKNDFIKHVFSYSIFDLKQFIEREYTWLDAPGQLEFSFYTYFCHSDKEFLDFAIPSDHSIEYYKQYYRKVIGLIENLDFEGIPQPEAKTPTPQFTKELRDRYKEYFGVERPSKLYENSVRVEKIYSEADAERTNSYWPTANVKPGDKSTIIPLPTTNEKAWERLVKLNAQQIFENLQIRWLEGTAPKAVKAIQDRLKVINKFIEEAESLSLIDATERPNFSCTKQEYLRIKYNYYNKNFCGSKDGISIPGRTPNDGLTASIYAEYYLFKSWLEDLLTEQSTNTVKTNTTSSRFDLVGFLIACKNWSESSSELRKYNERSLPTHFSKAKRHLNSFAANLQGKDIDFQIYLLEELIIEYLSFSENHPLAERIRKEIETTITALQQAKKMNEPTQSPTNSGITDLEAPTPQPIGTEQNRTKKVISEQFELLDKRGWEYAFRNETDYNTFSDLLTDFFEFKKYSLPKQVIQLKKGCKTRLAATLGKIHSELSNNDTLSGDNDFFEIVNVLSPFSELTRQQLYKDLSRHGKD